MSHVGVLLAARADAAGRAQRRTTVRHTHLTDRPLGLVAFQLANEPFSALAVGIGTGPADLDVAVVLEPRNRPLTFRALTPAARRFQDWFRSFSQPREVEIRPRSGRRIERAMDAPQLLVPNHTTVGVLERWGRRLAYLPTSGDLAADPALVEWGKHLQFLADHAQVPGQALVVAATTLLRRHWATGQSDLEDENLAALDAWIDPPAGGFGFEAAAAVEDSAVGPLLQPEDENRIFDLISDLNRVRAGRTDEQVCAPLVPPLEAACRPHVEFAWQLLWRVIGRERAFTEGASVPQRWTDDRQAYTEHLDWIDGGGRRRARDSARRAARLRLRLEAAQARLEAQEAVDDPLVLADYELAGKAVTGTVVAVDRSHTEPGPRRQVQRPLITLKSVEPCSMPVGKTLWWTADPGRVAGVVRDVTPSRAGGSRITIMITSGMRGVLPGPGARVGFSVLTLRQGPSLPLPQTLPWTHEPPAAADPTAIDDSARPGWEEAS